MSTATVLLLLGSLGVVIVRCTALKVLWVVVTRATIASILTVLLLLLMMTALKMIIVASLGLLLLLLLVLTIVVMGIVVPLTIVPAILGGLMSVLHLLLHFDTCKFKSFFRRFLFFLLLRLGNLLPFIGL